EWTSWALHQGMLRIRDLSDLVERARARAQAVGGGADRGAAAPAVTALPDSLVEFLCLLPPVEEGIRRRVDDTVGDDGMATAAIGDLPPECRTITRDVCLALLRLMQQLADLEFEEQRRSRRREQEDSRRTATAATDDADAGGEVYGSEALIPWTDKDAANVVLAAALAPHVLGIDTSDVTGLGDMTAAATAVVTAALRARLPYAATLEDGLRELIRRTLGSEAFVTARPGEPTGRSSTTNVEHDLNLDFDLDLDPDKGANEGRGGGNGGTGTAAALLVGDPVRTSLFVQGLSRLFGQHWPSSRTAPPAATAATGTAAVESEYGLGATQLPGGGGSGATLVGAALRARLRRQCLELARRLPGGGDAAPAARKAAADALGLALQLQLPVEDLLGVVLPLTNLRDAGTTGTRPMGQTTGAASGRQEDPAVVIAAAAAAGATFYDNFKAIVNRAILFDPDVSVLQIMRAISASLARSSPEADVAVVSTTAEAVLAGVVESLLRSRAAAVRQQQSSASTPAPPPAAFDLHVASFLAACRRHLPLLQPLSGGGGSTVSNPPSLESRLLLLRVLRLLLQLDAKALLQPGHVLNFIMDCYCGVLAPSSSASGCWTPALQLLPAFAVHLPSGGPLERLFGSSSSPADGGSGSGNAAAATGNPGVVISLVASVCPMNARRDYPDPTAPAAVDMSMRLHALMVTLVQLSYAASVEAAEAGMTGVGGADAPTGGGAARAAAAASLLKALLLVVQDMGGPMGHVLQTKLVRMFAQMAAAAWYGAPGAEPSAALALAADSDSMTAVAAAARAWPGEVLLSYSFSWVLLDLRLRGMREMRLALLQHVLLPLLAAAPAPYRVEWYGVHVRRMVHHIQDTAGAAGSAPGAPQLLNSWISYKLLQHMYNVCTANEANRKARVAPSESLRNAVLMGLCKRELCRPLPPPPQNAHDLQYKDLDRHVRCAAWAASAALLLRTQSRAGFFSKLLIMPDDRNGDPAFVWSRLLPDKAHFHFTADPSAPERSEVRKQRTRREQEAVRDAIREVRRQRDAVRKAGGGAGGPSASLLMGTLLGAGGSGGTDDDVASLAAKISASQYDMGIGLDGPVGTATVGGGSGAYAPVTPMGAGGTAAAAPLAYTWTGDGGGSAAGGTGPGEGVIVPTGARLGPAAAAAAAAAGDAATDDIADDDNPLNDELPYIDDEMDEHVCMLPLVQLIEKFSDIATWDMQAEAAAITAVKNAAAAALGAGGAGAGGSEVTAAAARGAVPDAPPPRWLSGILDVLRSPNTPRYTRLFLLKAVLQVEERMRQRKIRIQVQTEQQMKRPMGPSGLLGVGTAASAPSSSSQPVGSLNRMTQTDTAAGGDGDGDGDGDGGTQLGPAPMDWGDGEAMGSGGGDDMGDEEGYGGNGGGGGGQGVAEARSRTLPSSDSVFAVWAVHFFPALVDAEAAEAQ
ncbi:hypothetical protein VaNZ11_015598, partial [Volvox africanus]